MGNLHYQLLQTTQDDGRPVNAVLVDWAEALPSRAAGCLAAMTGALSNAYPGALVLRPSGRAVLARTLSYHPAGVPAVGVLAATGRVELDADGAERAAA